MTRFRTDVTSSINRRTALKAGLGAAAVSLVALRTAAQTNANLKPASDPLPLIDARFPYEIAKNVWLIPDKRIFLVPNVGIIVGKEAALVIDCGLGPENGRRVLQAAQKIAPGRRLILTQTHAHPEHAFGSVAFRNRAEIFLNRQQNDYLIQSGSALLELFRSSFSQDVGRLLEGVEIVPATNTYKGESASIDLGDRRVEFRNWGIAHSPGDQTIYLPQEKILFAGDLVEERIFPIVPYFPPTIPRTAINCDRWKEALSNMEQINPTIIVPGHGNLGRAEIARSVREYLEVVQNRVAKAITGEGVEEKIAQLKLEIQSLYPTWEHENLIEPAIRYFANREKPAGANRSTSNGEVNSNVAAEMLW